MRQSAQREGVRIVSPIRAAGLLVALLTTSCVATIQGGPERLYSVTDEVAQARYLLEEAPVLKGPDGLVVVKGLINSYYAVTADNDRKFYRNEVIARRMYIIDVQYSEYELSLTRDRQLVGFITSTANQGLSIGSTLAASQSSARILSALAGGVGAVKGIYDSELIIAKTIQIVEGQMRTQRDIVAKRITDKMDLSSVVYPLSAALTDLEDYYLAGTFNSGLLKALGEAGENARISGEIKGNAIVVRAGAFVPGETTSRILQDYLAPGPNRTARLKIMNDCLFTIVRGPDGSRLNVVGFMFGATHVGVRRDLIACARDKGERI